ncbi:hypothetical protein ABZT06_48450 [Streptomyces sp. NPDC005483]|uniref:hypothetical protein n=1 Tax=Streptomyces sp. NPDC005483 TaxID=3154882 RepID=UPI0033A7D295
MVAPVSCNGTYAADIQRATPDSTLHFYRSPLRLGRRHRLGAANLRWLLSRANVLDLTNGAIGVMTNPTRTRSLCRPPATSRSPPPR